MDEAVIKREMPHNLVAEQSVIGSMIMDAEAVRIALEILTKEDFYAKQYGTLFEAMHEMDGEGKPIDLITLKAKLEEMAVPPEMSAIAFLSEILDSVPTSANIKNYAELVREKSVLRRMIHANESIIKDCYAGTEKLDDILSDAEKKIFQMVQTRGGGDYEPIKDIVIRTLEGIEKAAQSGGGITGISTGFLDLDYKTSGFHPSELILVAARPAMGKTAFVLNMAQHMALKQGETVAIFSLEMDKEQLVNRILSMESKVDSQKMRTGNLEDSEWEMLIEAASTIGNSKLIIDSTPNITIRELQSKCRKYKMEHNLACVMIDYLQLMGGSGRSESRQQEISEISRSLKALARELKVPIVALSQLSRKVEERQDHRPMLSDLRESGAIEQDADMVMFIYRDDYYNPDTSQKGVAEIIIAKQRSGPIGTVELLWLPEYTKFANLAKNK